MIDTCDFGYNCNQQVNTLCFSKLITERLSAKLFFNVFDNDKSTINTVNAEASLKRTTQCTKKYTIFFLKYNFDY